MIFQSTPSARRATICAASSTLTSSFQSTPSARRATRVTTTTTETGKISIHALREEGDTSSCGPASTTSHISIHALREEGDADPRPRWTGHLYFNPRPPRGGRHDAELDEMAWELFQSTPSARRATFDEDNGRFESIISIHALREESDSQSSTMRAASTDFNPRPPRGERLRTVHWMQNPKKDFNPRPPRGERPSGAELLTASLRISIHALREESDDSGPGSERRTSYFNPRPPRGERPKP